MAVDCQNGSMSLADSSVNQHVRKTRNHTHVRPIPRFLRMALRLGFFVGFFVGFFLPTYPRIRNFVGFFVVRISRVDNPAWVFSGENVGRWWVTVHPTM